MHTQDFRKWQHNHIFGQNQVRPGEKRTLVIVVVTAVMMVVEISAGLLYGSMALLADGLHMASHAAALSISVVAYVFARRLAADPHFAFGTGKINSLAGFGSAVVLGAFAVAMVVESTDRLINPITISFDQALIVAVIGLFINGGSAWFLGATPHGQDHHGGHHDHNLRAAYLHVLADALISVLAISALLTGKYLGAYWLDPVMGIVGALVVTQWSYGLLKESAQILLDKQADHGVIERVRKTLEGTSNDRISDLHIWNIGPGIFAAEIAIISDAPQTPDHYKSLIPEELNIVHATIEVHKCPSH